MPQNPAILLIDDDAVIHEAVGPVLADAGFEVASARRAEQALLVFRRRANDFCAVVTDVNLGPGLSGWDLARLLREVVVDIPVVYVTGGRAHQYPVQGVAGSVVMLKPFPPEALVQALAALLRQPPAKIR